jgi:hypothetical protein
VVTRAHDDAIFISQGTILGVVAVESVVFLHTRP